MLSPTMARGILRHFPHGLYPSTADQRALPPPVRFPTSLSLQAISAAGAGGQGARGGTGRHKIPRDGGGAGRGGKGGGCGTERGKYRHGRAWAGGNRGKRDDRDGDQGEKNDRVTAGEYTKQQCRGEVPCRW